MPTPPPAIPTVAVVTGGHSYEVMNFHRLFRSLAGLDCYIQNLDDFTSSPKAVRQAYDAVVFYIMPREGPSDEKLPWYAGKPKTALSELGETQQGVVILHHAVLAYPDWDVWSELAGMADRTFNNYYRDQNILVQVRNHDHPITQGLQDWDLTDETYTMGDPDPDQEILLSVDHPKSMKHLAWTGRYKNSRVFSFISGHDQVAWANPNFREVLRRGIHWAAGRL